jgi:ATP-dependent protease HslVU (ClpYQ) peptidase subunit
VGAFANGLRAAMKEYGGEISNNNATEMDGRFLVGVHGQLFEIDSGYGVFSPRLSFLAIGCAAQEAMAGMFTAWSILEGVSGEEIVSRGLQAAAEFDINIRPPFTILSLPVAS